ncbi:MAG: response regulator [Geobacter sp.]|nr:response regulator [Geobacter sp.]
MNRSTILIVDDSAAMRSLLAATLEAVGDVTVIQANNGFEALRMLPREQVNLVLTDINMPDINGLELLSFIRNNPLYKELPVIVISTEGSQKDIEKGLALGATAYLVKPFKPEQLLELVKGLL